MTPEETNSVVLQELKAIRREVEAINKKLGSGGEAPRAQSGGGGDGDIASDHDLDGANGNPTIKYPLKEKYWRGEKTYEGYKFSETEPEFLDAMARYLDACAYMAAQDADEKKRRNARYKTLDAARARGWAKRLRNGWQAPQQALANDYGGTDYADAANSDIPF